MSQAKTKKPIPTRFERILTIINGVKLTDQQNVSIEQLQEIVLKMDYILESKKRELK